MSTQIQNHKFSMIYKQIKENLDFPFAPEQFVEKAKLFSIPIFNRILFVFTVVKFIIMEIYFIIYQKEIVNGPIICSLILIVLSIMILFLKQFSKLFFIQYITEYIFARIIRVVYLIIFFFEENYTIYYYKDFTFQINPSFVFVLNLSVFFFESSSFTSALLYLYIINMVSFVYYFSFNNFLNFYMRINTVIGMFVLVSVVAHNIGRKLIKRETFLKFFEKVLEIICKEENIFIVHDHQIIFPYEKGIKFNENKTDDFTETQSEASMTMTEIDDKNIVSFPVEQFEGFEVAFRDKSNRKMSFMVMEDGKLLTENSQGTPRKSS